MTLAARDLTALNRLAAKGFRVVVEGQGVRHVVEPMDAKAEAVQASDPFDNVSWKK